MWRGKEIHLPEVDKNHFQGETNRLRNRRTDRQIKVTGKLKKPRSIHLMLCIILILESIKITRIYNKFILLYNSVVLHIFLSLGVDWVERKK